jgi:hypothetical protein
MSTLQSSAKQLLNDNEIDRYVINDRTQGLKYGPDTSLDRYLQKRFFPNFNKLNFFLARLQT